MQVTQVNSSGVSQEKVKEFEDSLMKKNKEIYELTV